MTTEELLKQALNEQLCRTQVANVTSRHAYDLYDLELTNNNILMSELGTISEVTGYRPFGNMRIPFGKLQELERKGEEIRYDFGKKYEQQRNEIEALLKEAVSIAEFV